MILYEEHERGHAALVLCVFIFIGVMMVIGALQRPSNSVGYKEPKPARTYPKYSTATETPVAPVATNIQPVTIPQTIPVADSHYPVSYSGYTPTPAATPSTEPATSNVNIHDAAPVYAPATSVSTVSTASSVSSGSFDAWKSAPISASTSQPKPSYSSDNNSSSSYSDPLWTIKPNAYGMGVGENQYGQPVKIVPVHSSGSSYSDPLLTIKQDAYGMGVGSDQYGRPVKIVPAH